MAGKLIVIEGLDGSGKGTQTELLYKKLKEKNTNITKLTFPDYNNPSSSLVKLYLDGSFGSKPEDVNSYAASTFYSVDRVASYLQFWQKDYKNGNIILADRYSTSNIIYQMSKMNKSEYDDFINWLEDFEYNKLEIPKPDLVIYLDVLPEISQKLLLKRYNGKEEKKDLHEKNIEFLNQCRKSALYAADKLNWKVISCVDNGKIKSIDSIFNEIYSTTLKNINI